MCYRLVVYNVASLDIRSTAAFNLSFYLICKLQDMSENKIIWTEAATTKWQ